MALRGNLRKKRFLTEPRRMVRRWLRPLRGAFRPPDYGTLLKRVARLEANLRNVVFAQHAELAAADDQRTALRRAECRIFSESGEDGILLHLFGVVGVTDRRFIEFGIGDITKCNSTNLALSFGWSGLLLDGRPDLVERARAFYAAQSHLDAPRVEAVHAWVGPDDVNAIFRRHGYEGSIDLLSIDIDGNDYWVWKAIDAVEPRVVVIEYNPSLGPDEARITRYDPSFDRYDLHPLGWYHSASLPAMERLGRDKGYVLVGCDSSGLNAFFVRRDVADGRLRALSAKEAYYPEARRLRVASLEEQMASLRDLPYQPE